jgi:hypothetical protein
MPTVATAELTTPARRLNLAWGWPGLPPGAAVRFMKKYFLNYPNLE